MIGNILGLSLLSSGLYRLGGWSGGNKLYRRLGCAVVQFLVIFFVLKISAPWWVHLLSIGITYGFLTTYYDFINGEDSHWLHGLGIGLGIILYACVGAVAWPALIIRIVVLSLAMGLWSKWFKNDIVEECGRGFFIVATLLIL